MIPLSWGCASACVARPESIPQIYKIENCKIAGGGGESRLTVQDRVGMEEVGKDAVFDALGVAFRLGKRS